MTPRQQVALMIGAFSALGIGVSVGIIAAGGGTIEGLFNPPSPGDIYVVGAQLQDNSQFEYALTSIGPNSALVDADVSIAFNREGDLWRGSFAIVNGTGTRSDFDVGFSDQLTKIGQPDVQARAFLEPVETSIFAIREMDYRGMDKYLSVGSPWDVIFYSNLSVTVRITSQESVQTPAGNFDAYRMSYNLGERTSNIWVVRDLPFPVKAEVYDPDDQLMYEYELLNLRR